MLEQGRTPGISTVYQSLGNGTAARLLRQLVPTSSWTFRR